MGTPQRAAVWIKASSCAPPMACGPCGVSPEGKWRGKEHSEAGSCAPPMACGPCGVLPEGKCVEWSGMEYRYKCGVRVAHCSKAWSCALPVALEYIALPVILEHCLWP
eukprot:803044-Pelagomonas_calceolata.AAC.9